MDKKDSLSSGWTFDVCEAAVYHFEHVFLRDAEQKIQGSDNVHVVETINGTLVKGADPEMVHRNCYFAHSLNEAIAMAVRMIVFWADVAETIVGIRPATEAEIERYQVAENFYLGDESSFDRIPIGDREMDRLLERDRGVYPP